MKHSQYIKSVCNNPGKRALILILLLMNISMVFAQLGGTLTIGSSTGNDFNTISDAVSALESQGQDDDVIFQIESGNYSEQVEIDGRNINGNDEFSIVFVGEGERDDIIWDYANNTENADYTLSIEGANNISFSNITFSNSSTGNYASVVTVGNNAVVSGVTFNNCRFVGEERLDFSSFPTLLFFNSGGGHNILVQNCLFEKAYYGFTSFGTTELKLLNNTFLNQNIQAISVSARHASVKGNYIENSTNELAYSIGLEMWSSSDFIVEQNTIRLQNGAKGLQFQSSSLNDSISNVSRNNFLELSNTTNSIVGVTFDLATELDFIHNTVIINSLLSAVAFTGGSNVNVYNNILQNNGNGSVYSAILSVFHDADYNILYSNGILSTLGADLSEHQNNGGLDLNSQFIELEFPQEDQPNICHYVVNNSGRALERPATKDYYGTSRNTDTPDIGAYEFELPETIIFSEDSQDICEGDVLVLSPENGFISYLWINDESTSDTFEVTESGQYTVEVTDASGCILEDTIEITTQSVEVDLGDDRVLCVGNSETLHAGEGYATYLWSTGDTSESIEVTAAGSYTVEITNELGCTATDEIEITLAEDVLIPNFLVGGVGCTADPVYFIEVSNTEPDSVLWDFGDGNESTDLQPVHEYESGGDYTVTLTASLGGCILSVQKSVTITKTCPNFLIASYPLDTAANDISGNDLDGVLSEDFVFIDDDERGNVAFFDGSGDFIKIATSGALDMLNSSFTVSAWFKGDDLSASNPIIGSDSSEKTEGLNLGLYDKKAFMTFSNGDLNGTQNIGDDEWHFVTYTYESESSTFTIFVDGEKDASMTGLDPFIGQDSLIIGQSQLVNQFSGFIDDLNIWKEALTEKEIFDIYIGYSTNLIAYYPLSENANDFSGNEFHGSLSGNVTFVQDSERGFTANFPGSSGDYILLDDADAFDLRESSFIVSAWVNVNEFDKTDLGIFGSASVLGNRTGLSMILRDQSPYFGFWGDDTSAATTLATGQWYHISCVYDQINESQLIYVNGQLVASGTGKENYLGTDNLLIGNGVDFSRGMNGFIQDLKIRKINDDFSGRIIEELPEIPEDKFLVLYPNPTKGLVNLKFNSERSLNGRLAVHNIRGELVFETEIEDENLRIFNMDLSRYDQGLYIVNLFVSDQIYSSRVIVH